MEIYLKRYFWTLPVIIIILCAGLAAKATTNIIDAKLVASETPKPSQVHHKVVHHDAPKTAPSKETESLIARNMFCSTCEPAKVEAASQPAAPVDLNHPPATTLPLALVGTIVSEHSRYSTATILNVQSFHSGSYAVDEEIPDAGKVTQIKPKFVDFFNKIANRVERIELGAPPPPPGQVVAAAPPPQSGPPVETGNPDSDLIAAADRGVHKIDETHFDIDRALWDRVLGDPTAAARAARIVPSIKDGKANGFKMYAIRPNSVFAKVGFQNGDTILGINGLEMTSPDKALEVYTKLRSASAYSVSVLRRGQPISLEYSIK